MIRHQFHQARREIDQWLRLSTAVLARASTGAALATSPRSIFSRVKHLELIGIQDTVVLLVLVLATGTLKQQVITLEKPIFQDELSRASNQLNVEISGATAADLPEKLEGFTGFTREVGELVLKTLRQSEEQITERVYRQGWPRCWPSLNLRTRRRCAGSCRYSSSARCCMRFTMISWS